MMGKTAIDFVVAGGYAFERNWALAYFWFTFVLVDLGSIWISSSK